MKPLTLTLTLLLTACAAPKPYTTADGRQSETDRQQCDYEAERAVLGIRSTIEREFTKIDLIDQCMAIRGLRRR